MKPAAVFAVVSAVFAATLGVVLLAQEQQGFMQSFNSPAIEYYQGAKTDAVTQLVKKLQDGTARLAFNPQNGYLLSVLKALDVPLDSQVAVYSKTSFQSSLISRKDPRVIYFNDHVAVGWVRGGAMEVAAQDPRQGVMFYELAQTPDKPVFRRVTACLQCHVSWPTYGVPGMMVMSTGPDDAQGYATGGVTDDTTPFAQRWGGWYVTGRPGPMRHMGNVPVEMPIASRPKHPPVLASLKGQIDLEGYPTPYSDIVALMVLEHQTRMMNLLTYIGWQARVDAYQAKTSRTILSGPHLVEAPSDVRQIARTLADYMLFVDEAPLPGPVEGSSGFEQRFAAEGPFDGHGRSLRQFDLHHWLMKYPCSYMIYSAAFDDLPAMAKRAVYQRMWEILAGQTSDPRYHRRLTLADRQAVVQILRATKKDLPEYYQNVIR
ncbi:MAG TPA: hypothetical protein VNE16_16430 [Vicinamibacterales bacterium]|nr:hypothetical protein [Vicinamibacterales bacterium]